MVGDTTDGLVARRSAAVREATQRYGPEDVATAEARIGLALALGQDGQYAAAAREASEAVRVRTAVLGPTDPATIEAQRVLAGVLVRDGEWDRVAALYPSLVAGHLAAAGPHAVSTLGSRVNHAIALRRTGRGQEAEAELREVLPICVESLGDEHVVTRACRDALAG